MTDTRASPQNDGIVSCFKKAPKWQQWFIVAIFAIGGLAWSEKIADTLFGSRESRAYKAQIEPLAVQLVKAQKMGDKPTALALVEPTIKIVNDFNALDDAQKAAINNSPLRYCILAAIHLSSGPIEVLQTSDWASKSKYEVALNECS